MDTMPLAAPAASTRHALRFEGTAGEYFKIWIVNLALSVVTLGIFSAWAKVRSKRYLYGNTFIGAHAFDYHAQPLRIPGDRGGHAGRLFAGCDLRQTACGPSLFDFRHRVSLAADVVAALFRPQHQLSQCPLRFSRHLWWRLQSLCAVADFGRHHAYSSPCPSPTAPATITLSTITDMGRLRSVPNSRRPRSKASMARRSA